MQFSLFEPADAFDVVKLWRESFEYGMGTPIGNSFESQLNILLEDVVRTSAVVVAKQRGSVVAFMALQPDDLVYQLFVAIGSIGTGIGSRLLDLAKKSQSTGSLRLYTLAQNRVARRFYERHGFKEIGRYFDNQYKLENIEYLWLQPRQGAAQETGEDSHLRVF